MPHKGKTEQIALGFMILGSVWFVVGSFYGLVSAMHLVAPEIFDNVPWLVFSRTRPIHTNTVIYGFVCNILIGCGFYYLPALLRTRLWSPALGWITMAGWNLAILSGPLTFSFGLSQGREYAEYLFPADVLVVVAIVAGAINLIMTIARREEECLYVSVWYFLGMFLWMAGVYPIGNVMWHPSTGAMPGLTDSIVLWFYGHNLPGLLLTPLAVGAAYFVVPRITRTPLYSHTLSLVGFWMLVTLYTHIGGHHIIQAPIPNWLKTMSVVNSMAMLLPVAVVLINIWLTSRQRAGAMLADPAGRLVLAGSIWYLITCIQGPLQSLAVVQRITHFNNWTIGHAHIAVLGFSGFIALGAMWHILPLVTGRRVYSNRLVNLQFGLVMLGLGGFFTVLTAAGLVQGHAWYNGETVYGILPEIAVYMGLRALFGLSIITAAVLGLYILLMTMWHGAPDESGALAEEATR